MALPNLSQISEALDNIMPELTPVPVGTVAYAHEVPTGWLQCNGAEVSRTTYARLFRKIGTKYGAGNGSTTFNLPDLQHRVLEGTNTTSEVAQKVEAGLPDITGQQLLWGYPVMTGSAGALGYAGSKLHPINASLSDTTAETYSDITFAASRSAATFGRSATVQPSAVRPASHYPYLTSLVLPEMCMSERTSSRCGGLKWQKAGSRQNLSLDGTWQFGSFFLSASRSSAVHGKSQTVQMASVRLLAIIKI